MGVVGGSIEYSGAPFYAGIAALRAGSDLAFVFATSPEAAQAIKAYSPELIVFPGIEEYVKTTMPRLSALVLGPGLGRDGKTMNDTYDAIVLAKSKNVPVVLDGDALWMLKDRMEVVRGYKRAIITPNGAEFERLFKEAFGENEELEKVLTKNPNTGKEYSTTPDGIFLSITEEPAKSVARLSKFLGGVTVVRKGPIDVVSDGEIAVGCGSFGSGRRCGGQGDVLAGVSGLFLGWAMNKPHISGDVNPVVSAAYGACVLTRRANALAFEKEKRSMTTPDLIHVLGKAFYELYDDENSPYC